MTINPSGEVDQRARNILLNDLREEFVKALAPLMVGECFPVDILTAENGDVIWPANRKVTNSFVRRISFLARSLEYDRSQMPEIISETIDQFGPLLSEFDTIDDTKIVLPSDIPDAGNGDIYEPQIDGSDRSAVLCVIRKVFSNSTGSHPCFSITNLALTLGFKPDSKRACDVLRQDLLTAVAHSIIKGRGGKLMIVAEDITRYEEDILTDALIDAIGYDCKEHDEAVRLFARWLGFASTTPTIKDAASSLITDLIRKGRLEQSDTSIRRTSEKSH